MQRFRAEAEAAAGLDHPAIVPVYEVGEHEGQHFFSMGLVQGESLASRVSRGPLPPSEAADLTRKIAEAVEFAHSRGVVHRDLKPANVLLDAQGEPKVTDFGLAKRIDAHSELTSTGQVLGTPAYMAPEQASGRISEIGPRTDVYSLGAILYCLLTGHPPFQCATPLDTLVQVIDQDPIPPRQVNSQVPQELDTICLKCLKKSPGDRYASAADLSAELGRFLEGVPILAQNDTALSLAWRMIRRETRHVDVLRRWGRVWICHAGQLLVLFLITNVLTWSGVVSPWPYVALWTVGIAAIVWAIWHFRFRDAIPLINIERQVGQVWCAFFVAVVLTGLLNHLLGFESLKLLPLAVVECGLAFAGTAAILGGSFYTPALACAGSAILMALFPRFGPAIFGVVFSLSLFWPAWKHSRGVAA